MCTNAICSPDSMLTLKAGGDSAPCFILAVVEIFLYIKSRVGAS